jgi:hypothetical protein
MDIDSYAATQPKFAGSCLKDRARAASSHAVKLRSEAVTRAAFSGLGPQLPGDERALDGSPLDCNQCYQALAAPGNLDRLATARQLEAVQQPQGTTRAADAVDVDVQPPTPVTLSTG